MTSLVLNIAEGNGRFSEADQIRFLDIAHTSSMRVATCLDLLAASRLRFVRSRTASGYWQESSHYCWGYGAAWVIVKSGEDDG